MAGFHGVADEALVVEGSYKILINVVEVSFRNFHNIIQLTTNTAR